MTSVLTGPEISMMLAIGLLLGGAMGAVTGSIINKALAQFKHPVKESVFLGIVGYWVGASASSLIWQGVTGNGAAVKVYLLAALAGSVAMTVLGSVAISSFRRTPAQQAKSEN